MHLALPTLPKRPPRPIFHAHEEKEDLANHFQPFFFFPFSCLCSQTLTCCQEASQWSRLVSQLTNYYRLFSHPPFYRPLVCLRSHRIAPSFQIGWLTNVTGETNRPSPANEVTPISLNFSAGSCAPTRLQFFSFLASSILPFTLCQKSSQSTRLHFCNTCHWLMLVLLGIASLVGLMETTVGSPFASS